MKSQFNRLFILFFLMLLQTMTYSQDLDQNSSIKIKHYDIEADMDLKNKALTATTQIQLHTIATHSKLKLLLNRSLTIDSIHFNGKPVKFGHKNHSLHYLSWIIIDIPKSGDSSLSIKYHGKITSNMPSDGYTGSNNEIITDKGAFLSDGAGWYPFTSSVLATFKLSLKIPKTYQAVCEGNCLSNAMEEDVRTMSFLVDYPLPGLTLVCGEYVIESINYKGIEIATYFTKQNQDLSKSYIDYSKTYIDLYQNMIADYPFSKFYVVENFLQTGFGMSSFTLIGDKVLRLPFIVKSSLGHEILHSWWGNTVYVQENSGNWCEGLANYLADYYYKEKISVEEASRYRRNILKNYSQYFEPGNDFPLSQFTHRSDFKSMTLGYGKGMMVFHQLRKIIQDKAFFDGLKSLYQDYRFKYLDWKGIEKHFTQVYEKDLSWFFKQWVYETGAAELQLNNVSQIKIKNAYELSFTLSQTGNYILPKVPIALTSNNQTKIVYKSLTKKQKLVKVQFKDPVDKIQIDPDCDIFRRLSADEIPPSLSLIYSDKSQKVWILDDDGKKSIPLINDKQVQTTGDKSNDFLLKDKTLIVTGLIERNSFYKQIQAPNEITLSQKSFSVKGKSYTDLSNTLVYVMKNPYHAKGILVIYSLSDEISSQVLRKLSHYQDYGYLVFNGSTVIDKGELSVSDHALIYKFRN